jgi:hypothetical protein
MSTPTNRNELLVAFERNMLKGGYKEFYKAKRENWLGTIERNQHLWEIFQLLDESWTREINDLATLTSEEQILPALLFQHAHIKFRIARELAFSRLLVEGWSILRAGIESTAHAYRVHKEPRLALIWSGRERQRTKARRAYEEVFEDRKREYLFPKEHGLEILGQYWSDFSEYGSHSNVGSVSLRFQRRNTPNGEKFRLSNFEASEPRLVVGLTSILEASHLMENLFFHVFEKRFELDPQLMDMRADFKQKFDEVLLNLVTRYNISSLLDPGSSNW